MRLNYFVLFAVCLIMIQTGNDMLLKSASGQQLDNTTSLRSHDELKLELKKLPAFPIPPDETGQNKTTDGINIPWIIVAIFMGNRTELEAAMRNGGTKNELRSISNDAPKIPWHLVLAAIRTDEPLVTILDFVFSAKINNAVCNGTRLAGSGIVNAPVITGNETSVNSRRLQQISWDPHTCDIRGGIYGRYMPCMTPALAVSNQLDLVRGSITGNYPFPALRGGRPFAQTVGWYN